MLLRISYIVFAVLVTLSVARGQTKPEWRFSVLASVGERTVDHYGGLPAVRELLDQQFNRINERFNRPDVFNGLIIFDIDSVNVYTGDPYTQSYQPHPDQDYQIVYDRFSDFRGNWIWPPVNSVLILVPTTAESIDPLGEWGALVLTHELGHARGAVDLYGMKVSGNLNEVSGTWYYPERSIMNSYSDSVWDQHSINIINRRGERVLESDEFRLSSYFSSTIGIKLINPYGFPVPWANVSFYAHEWYDFDLLPEALAEGTTDADGVVVFDFNPFTPRPSDQLSANAWNIKNSLLLVAVEAGGESSYYWLPFTNLQNAYFSGATTEYFAELIVAPTHDDAYQSVPGYFTLYQNYPNPFNAATEICMSLEKSATVRVEVYNLIGRRTAVVHDGPLDPGRHSFTWDASAAASGIYLCRVSVDGKTAGRKMVLLK